MKTLIYEVKSKLVILDKLFLEGDTVYITNSFHVMNGVYDYARKVYDCDKNYLGMIRDDEFYKYNLTTPNQ